MHQADQSALAIIAIRNGHPPTPTTGPVGRCWISIRTVDYPEEFASGYHVMLTRWSQPCSLKPLVMRCWQPAKVGHELSSFALCQDDDKTYSPGCP